jgi:hypothetical protein
VSWRGWNFSREVIVQPGQDVTVDLRPGEASPPPAPPRFGEGRWNGVLPASGKGLEGEVESNRRPPAPTPPTPPPPPGCWCAPATLRKGGARAPLAR